MARFAPLYDVQIWSASADVRIVIDRRDKLGLEGPGAAARGAHITLRIDSPSPADQVAGLSRHAERACHAACSLAVPVALETETLLNGQALKEDK